MNDNQRIVFVTFWVCLTIMVLGAMLTINMDDYNHLMLAPTVATSTPAKPSL